MTKRIPIVPILLVVNTGAIVFGLMLVLTRSEPKRVLAVHLEPANARTSSPDAATRPAAKAGFASWLAAEKLHQAGKHAGALVQYAALAEAEPDPAVRSLLFLRQGQCLLNLRRLADARNRLGVAREGPSETVRAMANFELARLDAAERLGLQARRHAYEALATNAEYWPAGLEDACDLIVARGLVDQGLMLCNSPASATDKAPDCTDPFADKPPDVVRGALMASCPDRKPSALDIPIAELNVSDAGAFRIHYNKTPLEDFLGRLAMAAKIRLRWHESVAPDVRRRSVSLCAEFPSSMRAAEIACGQAGLVARFTGEEVVVHDPGSCRTVADRRELICEEAFSAWRRLLLRAPAAETAAPGHLLLGMLYEAMGKTASALSEYRYISRAYPHEGASAEALLRCGRLRMGLRDYGGARGDLLEMLDRFPDHRERAGVYLSLAECELQTGKVARAIQLYMRLYDLGASTESRQAASLGAGRCLHRMNRPAEAAVWVERYLAGPRVDSHGTAEAQVLLAQCRLAMGQTAKAIAGLQRALGGEMSNSDRTELMLTLSETLSQGDQCGRALVVMGNIDKDKLSSEQMYRYVAMSARLFQHSGLDEKAAGLLRSQMGKTTDPARYARLEVELARCREASGDLEEARQLLVEAVGALSPAPETRRAIYLLARICLRGGHYSQAIAVCRQLVQADEPDIRDKANMLLAEAYLASKKYQLAAASLAAAGQTGGTDK